MLLRQFIRNDHLCQAMATLNTRSQALTADCMLLLSPFLSSADRLRFFFFFFFFQISFFSSVSVLPPLSQHGNQVLRNASSRSILLFLRSLPNITTCVWGRNSSDGSVLGSLSCVMQHQRFDPPLSLR